MKSTPCCQGRISSRSADLHGGAEDCSHFSYFSLLRYALKNDARPLSITHSVRHLYCHNRDLARDEAQKSIISQCRVSSARYQPDRPHTFSPMACLLGRSLISGIARRPAASLFPPETPSSAATSEACTSSRLPSTWVPDAPTVSVSESDTIAWDEPCSEC